jgi:glycosyltransferase involved in cell wall biosynthesis
MARGHSSVVLHGKISDKELQRVYDEAILMIGTSETEGFPVTFIEAWSRGIPVLSTFDPDGVIAKHGLGWHVSSIEEFVDSFRTALTCSEEWQAASEAAGSYYLGNHTLKAILPKYESFFNRLMQNKFCIRSQKTL